MIKQALSTVALSAIFYTVTLAAPVTVYDVSVSPDSANKRVTVNYRIAETATKHATVHIDISSDAGQTWNVPAESYFPDSDIGPGVVADASLRQLVWDARADWNQQYSSQMIVRVSADDMDEVIAYYPFDGNVRDASGNGIDGELYGCTWAQDRFGRSNDVLSLNGEGNDYVDMGSVSMAVPVTVSLWFKSTVYNEQYATMLGWNDPSIHNGIQLAMYEGRLIAIMGDAYGSEGHLLGPQIDGDGQWHMFTVTKNETGEFCLYTDGVLQASETSTEALGNNHNLYIGRSFQPLSYGEYFNGLLDDVQIYSKAFSSNEVYMLWQNAK